MPKDAVIIMVLPQKGCEDATEVYRFLDSLVESRGGAAGVLALVASGAAGLSQLAMSWAKVRGVPAVVLPEAGAKGKGKKDPFPSYSGYLRSLAAPGGSETPTTASLGGTCLVVGVDPSYAHVGGRHDLTRHARWAQSLSLEFVAFDQGEERRARLRQDALFYSSIKDQDDGVKFINVYSRGRTKLGRMMSNFASPPVPLTTAEGDFASVEGYWFYLGTGSAAGAEREELHRLTGFQAKSRGGELRELFPPSEAERLGEMEFREKIKDALVGKLLAMPELAALLVDSTLPFVHYYVYGEGEKSGIVPGEGLWLVDAWEWLRESLR